ncbi:E3 ubiquitin-protein ligase makorin-3-like isoform X5 [Vicugna pacos]|uniref:RING-type E3 ubiquitin transferase n=1 Tax=Vicugna pacos TaxID=30538 RepID=A0ABM5BXZ4_VICPA
MDLAGPDHSGGSGESNPYNQRPCRNFDPEACHWGSSCCFAQDQKASQVCRYFQRGFCFHGGRCSYQHPQPPRHLEWGRRHSEPQITLPGSQLGLTRRGSEPTYLPSVAVGWGWARGYRGMEPGLEEFNKAEEREHDSRDIMCGICMDKVWDKPEAQRIFGILPNCSHAHCLGCLRTWRKSRQDFPLDVIKACPQCRVHSSYIIPCKFWVSKGPKKEQLIRNFKARTSQIRCRFFIRGNGRCPFQADCIYLHQLPDKALTSDPPWTKSMQLASVSEVVGTTAYLGGTEPEEEVFFMDCALAMAFWGSELPLDPNSSYHCLL